MSKNKVGSLASAERKSGLKGSGAARVEVYRTISREILIGGIEGGEAGPGVAQ